MNSGILKKKEAMKYFSTFAGMGAFEEAVRRLGLDWQCIGYSEIDKYAISRYMKCWTNSFIVDKLKSVSEMHGVHVKEQDSTYRSQRCSDCGMVHKSNRKGKSYECINCGNIIDADLNASLNHVIELPEVPFEMRNLKLNRKGFFWKSDGFFSLDGEEFTVPLSPITQETNKSI